MFNIVSPQFILKSLLSRFENMDISIDKNNYNCKYFYLKKKKKSILHTLILYKHKNLEITYS